MNQQDVDTSLKRSLIMRGGLLAQLPVFLAVAEKRSFTGAARWLGISPSAVSQAIARLERELGLSLVLRTTRSVNLTEAGARLAAQARPALGLVETTLAELAEGRARAQGILRLNVPRLACLIALPPLLAAYARAHPEVRVDVVVDDRNVDIVREGFDAGIRLREAVERDMVTLRLSPPIRFVVVGSKRYLAARGRPKHPRELVDHACIAWRSPTTGEQYRWEFEQRGRSLEVDVEGPISSNDADVLIACADLGLGLTYVAEHEVRPQLSSGRLETVLESFCPEVPGLFLYYPRAAQRVATLAAFVEVVKSQRRKY